VNKILLTGSTGFIGSALLDNLSKNNKIYIIVRKKNKIPYKNKNILKIYFDNYDKLNKKLKKINVNTVIHCATHYVKNHKYDDLKKLSNSNILFGNIILENLGVMNVKKFINFSTVWTNYNGVKGNFFNLYSVYKENFNNILNFYSKFSKNVKFYNLNISDTFGKFDKRKKIINVLKINYKKNLLTTIISKNLHLNLLNISDITNAVKLILKGNVRPDSYILKNNKNFSISKIVDSVNSFSRKKIKVKWLSNKIIKEKIYNYRRLKKWKPINSNIRDIVDIIKK
tara:strand:+ start:810 stop:1661 length:852 start_codon:yes stop_codon:yes gene_type:complete